MKKQRLITMRRRRSEPFTRMTPLGMRTTQVTIDQVVRVPLGIAMDLGADWRQTSKKVWRRQQHRQKGE